jgi:hypothetical protein
MPQRETSFVVLIFLRAKLILFDTRGPGNFSMQRFDGAYIEETLGSANRFLSSLIQFHNLIDTLRSVYVVSQKENC